MSTFCAQNCRSSNSFFRSGTFTYICPYPLPSPLFFNLGNYNLTIVYLGGTDYKVQVTEGSSRTIDVVDFSIEFLRFVISSKSPEFDITTESDDQTLVISTVNNKTFASGVTWRVDVSAFSFTSCLSVFSGYNACDAQERIILEANAQIRFTCAFLPTSSTYNLVDYTLYLQYENGIYYVAVDQVNPMQRIRVTQFQYTNSEGFTNVVSLEPSLFSASGLGNVFSLQRFGGPIWKLRGSDTVFYPVLLTPRTPRSPLEGIPLPRPPTTPSGCPTLFGELFLTNDGKQLCQTNFSVTFYNDCFTSQQREYVFYCIDILRVVCGQGCTLEAKAINLQGKGLEVTTAGLATYGMLRLMLSFLLFGHFDINFLRRRFYAKFLRKLERSGFCAYKEIFLESPYWKYFKN